MHDSFKVFLSGTKKSDLTGSNQRTIPSIKENINMTFKADDRTKILQEKVAYFCKKYGEIGADALDDFFKESVEKFSGFKNINSKNSSELNRVVESAKIPTDPLERANLILAGEPTQSIQYKSKASTNSGDDMLARAASIM